MRNGFLKITILLIPLCLSADGQPALSQEPAQENELNLTDLTAYRAALSGKATADDARATDPAARVGFRDLWERSDAHRGRRVTVQGRVERIFRQGPVGSFPALVQVWAYSTAGDPFCLVFPRPTDPITPSQDPESRTAIPSLGQTVQFTGTFLKVVRYAAGDGARLAPLIVGARPPAVRDAGSPGTDGRDSASSPANVLRAMGGEGPGASGPTSWAWSPTSWGLALTLAAVAIAIIAWQHLRGAQLRARAAMRTRRLDPESGGGPVSFLDSTQESHTIP